MTVLGGALLLLGLTVVAVVIAIERVDGKNRP